MQFESLANEILIECFEYLHIFDLLYSFDQLNSRFHQLIRYISIHLDFQSIHHGKFLRFFQQIRFDHHIRQQISSLRLSNQNQHGQIVVFFSCFSPIDLSHLHSLTLIHLQQENLLQLKSLLPSITKLTSFHLISSQINDDEILSLLPKSHLRSFLIHTHQPTLLITHLTITCCCLEQLSSQLFQFVPSLKYLNIEHIKQHNSPPIISQTLIPAVHLKQLIIGQLNYSLEDFENFVQQTPNLQSLTINADHNLSMINVDHWEDLITTFLLQLKIFQFKFIYKMMFFHSILPNFELFLRPFWIKQHHWHVQFLFDKHLIYIYTGPYLSKNFQFKSKMQNVTRQLFPSDRYGFDNVTHLSLNFMETTNERSFHFPNVISLKLVTSTIESPRERMSIESLKTMVNLSHVKHLDLSTNQKLILSGELLQILKESTIIIDHYESQ